MQENIVRLLANRHCERLIIGKPISQYVSYSVMFCPLHSNITKEQHEKHLCNPSSHYRKYGEYTREACPHISIYENHSVSISAMANSSRHSMRSASAIFMSRTKAISCLPQIITLRGCEEKNGRSKGYKGSTLMQALQQLRLVKRHISGRSNVDQ